MALGSVLNRKCGNIERRKRAGTARKTSTYDATVRSEEFSASVYDKFAPNRVGLTPNPGRLIGAAAGIRTRVPGCLLNPMGTRCPRPASPPALLDVESLGWL